MKMNGISSNKIDQLLGLNKQKIKIIQRKLIVGVEFYCYKIKKLKFDCHFQLQ